ncbi:hypothetical protein TA3x_005280 [Tundrisphaera sp. TA3]|uniref:hypothetical protein n=1 Tax=Tundrisphaera sp. TA3 TaxID=3435775 RepID=UPI003EB6C375
MRRRFPAGPRPASLAVMLLALAWAGGASPARAQVPQPHRPDVRERSGLIRRFDYPINTGLPKDPYRDNFYGTRFADRGKILPTNTVCDQGLYGVRLPADDTASVYPFFYGSPGRSTITAESKAWPRPLRAVQQLVNQRKPVGMYYDRGSYVPIYDLDSFAPGPGPDYWPFFFQGSRGG